MSKELVAKDAYSDSDLALIRATVAKGASDREFEWFLYRAKAMRLNPLKPGQIYFVKFGQNPGTIIVGIDGMRSLAARTGKHRGTKRGLLKTDSGALYGAWAEVSRESWDHPARVEVSMQEYAKQGGNWKTMPETMIQKTAEAAALRMAFPDELGGLYSEEERPVNEIVEPPILSTPSVEITDERPEFESIIETPSQDAHQSESVYIFKTGGTRKGKPLTAFTPERLKEFIKQCDDLEASGKAVSNDVISDYSAAMEYLEDVHEKT